MVPTYRAGALGHRKGQICRESILQLSLCVRSSRRWELPWLSPQESHQHVMLTQGFLYHRRDPLSPVLKNNSGIIPVPPPSVYTSSALRGNALLGHVPKETLKLLLPLCQGCSFREL